MKEKLTSAINKIQNNRQLLILDEASIKSGIVLHLLSLLGWNPFDIDEVKPEYTVESRRVDFSLRISSANKAFIEVKRPNENLEPHQEQLLGYSFREGVKLAILTNGITWWFYLPLVEGSWEDRRFLTADFSEQESALVAEWFIALLSKENVASGDAIKHAEYLHTSNQKKIRIKEALPKAWYKIVSDPDDLLVELLIDTAAKLSGFRPEISDVEKFLSNIPRNTVSQPKTLTPSIHSKPMPISQRGISMSATDDYINKIIQSFTLLGKTYKPRYWKELLVTVSKEMYRRHTIGFDQCLTLRGSRMVYFSMNKDELKQPTQISDSKYFVETKLNSNSIVKRSRELMALFGYKESDLTVITA